MSTVSGSKKGRQCHKISLEETMPQLSLKGRIRVRQVGEGENNIRHSRQGKEE